MTTHLPQLKSKSLSTLATLFLALHSTTGAIVLMEGFETDGNNSRYTTTGGFSDGGDDYFLRTDSLNGPTGLPAYTGLTGSYFWSAEDTQDVDNPNGDSGWIEFSNISTGGETLFTLSLDVAAGSTTNFDNTADYLTVFFQTASSPWTPVLSFKNDGGGSNRALQQDSDLDGIGEGDPLSLNLTTFTSAPITIEEATFDLRIEAFFTAGSEAVGFDQLVVTAIPEPALTPFIAGILLLMLRVNHSWIQPLRQVGSNQEAEPK